MFQRIFKFTLTKVLIDDGWLQESHTSIINEPAFFVAHGVSLFDDANQRSSGQRHVHDLGRRVVGGHVVQPGRRVHLTHVHPLGVALNARRLVLLKDAVEKKQV